MQYIRGVYRGRGSVTQGKFPYLTIASYLLSHGAFFCALNAPKLVCNRGFEPYPPLLAFSFAFRPFGIGPQAAVWGDDSCSLRIDAPAIGLHTAYQLKYL